MVEAVAGDISKLALDHALAADVLGTLLGEDLGIGLVLCLRDVCGWAPGAREAPLTAAGAESLISNMHASVSLPANWE